MEKRLKGYVFRMYPNINQQILIEKSFGVNRYIYNYFLEKSKQQFMNVYEYIKELPRLTKENIWLKEVDSCLLRTSIFDLDNAYQKCRKEKVGFPHFKSKASYRTNNIVSTYKGKTYESIKLDLEKRIVTLPKLKEIPIRGYWNQRKINGKIINAIVYKEVEKYYVSLCIEETITPKFQPTSIVGIKELVITSEGKIYQNQKQIKKYEKKIKGLNKWLARAKVGSQNRYKIKKKLTRVYQKLKNVRKYYLHKISKEIVEEHDMIVTENLKIRKWICKKCNNENERDLNASMNIMFEGVKKYMEELQVS